MSITIESNQLLKNLLVDLPSVLMAFAYGAGIALHWTCDAAAGRTALLQQSAGQRRVPDVYASCHAG